MAPGRRRLLIDDLSDILLQDRVKQVKYDIYSTITLIHSRKITPESEHEPPYPHLHTLLAFDTQVVTRHFSYEDKYFFV